MKTRSKNRLFARWMTCLVLALVSIGLAATAQAGINIDHIPPTVCKSSSLSFLGERVEYNGGAIGIDSSSSRWAYDIVTCPINRFRPGDEVIEFRINMESDSESSSWCQIYESPVHDRAVYFQ